MRTTILTALAAVALTGCDRAAPPASPAEPSPPPAASRRAAVDLRNWVLEPPVVPEEPAGTSLRLVCTAPSATEICCALGLRGQIVGRTRFCDYPPGIEALPTIGALDETNVEVLLGLKPDLILISGTSRAITDRLRRLELRFESLPDRSLADIFAAIERVGRLTQRPETARRLCTGIQGELERVAERYNDVPPARVLLLLGTLSDPPAPPFVAGPGSFYDDLLRRAGHENIVDGSVRAYGPLSLEFIARANPDVIIELDADGRGWPAGDAGALRVWSQVGQLQAVASDRVHVLTGQEHFIPGPRVARTFAELCRAIAGEQYE